MDTATPPEPIIPDPRRIVPANTQNPISRHSASQVALASIKIRTSAPIAESAESVCAETTGRSSWSNFMKMKSARTRPHSIG
jgi:hypothetical protein